MQTEPQTEQIVKPDGEGVNISAAEIRSLLERIQKATGENYSCVTIDATLCESRGLTFTCKAYCSGHGWAEEKPTPEQAAASIYLLAESGAEYFDAQARKLRQEAYALQTKAIELEQKAIAHSRQLAIVPPVQPTEEKGAT